MSFSVTKKTRGVVPERFFLGIKNIALTEPYELSLALISSREMRLLNRRYRHKDYPTDILSFPYSTGQGEILLCLPQVRLKAKKFALPYQKYLGQLFIHGLLHLKGMRHGRTMERHEKILHRRFDLEAQ